MGFVNPDGISTPPQIGLRRIIGRGLGLARKGRAGDALIIRRK